MVLLARFVSTDWFNPALVGCVAVSFFQKSQLEDFIRTETTRAGQVWGRGCELLRPSGGGQEGCAERAQRAKIAKSAASMRRSAHMLRKAAVIQETGDEETFDNKHVEGLCNTADGDTKYITHPYYKKHTEYNNNQPLVKKDLASMLAPSEHGPSDSGHGSLRTITGNAVVDLEIERS